MAMGASITVAGCIIVKLVFEIRASARVLISLPHDQQLASTFSGFQAGSSMVAAISQGDRDSLSC
jgi:hypothetical protein